MISVFLPPWHNSFYSIYPQDGAKNQVVAEMGVEPNIPRVMSPG